MVFSPNTTRTGRAVLLASLIVLVLGLAGCRKAKQEPMTGKVIYDGQPVTGGMMKLHAPGGKITIPITIKNDGTFTTTDVPPGEYKVTVETESVKEQPDPASPKMPKDFKPPTPPKDVKVPPEIDLKVDRKGKAVYVKIPLKYADVKSTDLTWTVGTGKNDKVFELKD
jgi:hypothetical protein